MDRCHMRTLLSACLLLLSLGCVEERATISAAAALDPPIEASMLKVTFRDGFRIWQAHGADFTADGSFALPHSPEWSTGTAGDISVAFELRDTSGTVLSAGEVTIGLRPDWRWTVDFMTSTRDPRTLCFGCFGGQAFAIQPAYRTPGHDSLWVVWGGNSIRHPVIY